MKKKLLFALIIVVSACQQADQPEPAITQEATDIKTSSETVKAIPKGQLSKDIVPKHVTLELTIVPDDDYFLGTTTIYATINKAQNSYYIHGNLLSVGSVEIKTSTGELIEGEYNQVDDSGIAQITFPKAIESGDIELAIDYRAKFNESLEGLYRVKDGDINYAFTQFESISARLAFPGFDEPAFKVPFDVSLIVKENHVAIANTPLKTITQLPNGMKRLDFVTSKPLPAYLVAFAVGEFDVVNWNDLPKTNVRNRTLPLRGLATKGKGGKLKYALQHTQEIVEGLENYFQIPYPYLKLDIVAVPDFSAGAMENAGLITYREQLLLLDDNASVNQKRRYMMVHAHELAHQWFGNLVTPFWWNDIWLNEAFATWMSYTALSTVYPEQHFDQAIINRALGAMANDSLISARQIRQPIKSNHDISSAFDGITYSKGAGVLEMMNQFLTPQQFRNGIHDYMTQYAFKNANADEFIVAISHASQNIPAELINSSFNSFLEQPGIPYLSVKSNCRDGVNKIAVSQSRYLPLGSQGSTDKKWKIPACFSYEIDGKKHKDCEIIEKKQQEFNLSGKGCAQYIMPNSNGSGYYRYALSDENWHKLYENLDNLNANETISLNDSFSAAVKKGTVSFSTLMQIAPIIAQSELDSVATSPMAMITYMKEKVTKTEIDKQKLAIVANTLYQQQYARLGFINITSDSIEDKKLRTSVIQFLAQTAENKAIRKKLVDMAYAYTGYQTDEQFHEDKIDTNLITLALKVAVKDSPQDFTNLLLELFDKSNDGTVRGRLLSGIASSKNSKFIPKLRNLILSDKLRDNEIFTILFSQVADINLQDGMFQWVKDNFETFKKRIPIWGQGRLPAIGSGFCTETQKQSLENFFNPIIEDLSGGPRYLAQTIEGINLCIVKLAHDKLEIRNYFNSFK